MDMDVKTVHYPAIPVSRVLKLHEDLKAIAARAQDPAKVHLFISTVPPDLLQGEQRVSWQGWHLAYCPNPVESVTDDGIKAAMLSDVLGRYECVKEGGSEWCVYLKPGRYATYALKRCAGHC